MRTTDSILWATAISVVALLAQSAGSAATYYVAQKATGASDRNNGLQPTHRGGVDGPLLTIAQALAKAQPGDTVVVHEGRYQEQVTLDKPGIKLIAAAGQRPLIDGAGTAEYGIVAPRGTPLTDAVIEGFEIAHVTLHAISVRDRASRGVVIRNNVLHDAWQRGIDVYGSEHRIEGNLIYMIGNDQEAMGIHLGSATENCIVRDNDSFLCKKTAIRDQTGRGNTIEGNLMHQCWTGLDLNVSSGTRVFNNYLYDNCQGFNPKHLKGHSGWNQFWHNTLYGNHGSQISIAVNRQSGTEGPGPDCDYLDIQNNVLVRCGSSFIWSKPDIVGENLVIDNNLYYGPPEWPPYYYHTEWSRGGRPGLASLDDVRAQTPFEPNGRSLDPQLRDPDAGELSYPDSSPAARGGAQLDSPYKNQLGARGVRPPATRFVRVPIKAVAASTSEELMANTTDGRYCTGWHSGTATQNQWVTYELQSRQPFTHIILTPVGHQIECNVRLYAFEVSDDGQRYEPLIEGENNDSGSTFIYELKQPIAPRYLRFRMLDKFPDDGATWSLNRLEFDELSVGYCSPSLDRLPAMWRDVSPQ